MAKIKHTKNELKAQREALRRYERFLPMLQLKKQQLQAETQAIENRIAEKTAESDSRWNGLEQWAALFSEPVELDDIATLEDIRTEQGNIAGVAIPVFIGADIRRKELDLYSSPPWLDDAADTVAGLIALRAEIAILEEQKRLVQEELRTTAQRVNLFEKVKIPGCKENIRIIKIFLGDEQTAGVVRGKIAKAITAAREEAEKVPA
ncbi:MAG: V-type ATP synthase subunit D [Lentisphaerae bacterium]|nr:V-type ATP synthase subunit D [Lentisphaerota bacterium]